ncbi:MAG: ABC transporter substrate-binding protein [Spirochaetia bacterium]|nr:ABC transporter substrate-binding protein [Spirochaetia bacterium]
MKIGVVKHLNARPLTLGLEKTNEHSILYENPSVLKEELLNNNLDLALISSVECIRNEARLDYSMSTGVCAEKRVRSILFFENKNEVNPDSIFVDEGSRSSVALLKILYHEKYKILINTIPLNPTEIQSKILEKKGSHLLFGDNALLANWDKEAYQVYDLAEWWNTTTGLNFIFALWAYPKNFKIDDVIFYSSLEFGLQKIDEIISNENRFSKEMIANYLLNELHYVVTEKDRLGFELFKDKCLELKLL